MPVRSLVPAVVPLLLFLSLSQTITAAPLATEEAGYVVTAVGTAILLSKCDGYELVDNALLKFGDVNGVDAPKFNAAILAAMNALGGREYDRSDLIPEVTRQTRLVAAELAKGATGGTAKFCKSWGEILADKGIVRRKK